MGKSNVVPALLLRPVFGSYVVPALLPWRQQVVGVAAEIGDSVAGSWRRGVPAKLGVAAGGHGPAFAATGVLPVRRPAP
jgi:hypothetical protein